MERNYGEKRNCAGCRYWSEMLAEARDGHVAAMCLAPEMPRVYRRGSYHCDWWRSGHLGAIDEPGADPEAYDNEAAF